jgi:hypothetical protein
VDFQRFSEEVPVLLVNDKQSCLRASESPGLRRFIVWLLKNFWFPILIIILAQLGKKYSWANEVHTKLKKLK